jgi:CTP:molybdopterin cytidylyltransferase MocA
VTNVGVLLAGGASRRMGSPKALARDGHASFMAHGIRHLWSACPCVVAVLGARADAIRRAVEEEFTRLAESGALQAQLGAARRGGGDFEVHFRKNPRWASGMLSSVRVGLREALSEKPSGILVLPVDHPSVEPRTVANLATVLDAAVASCRTPAERRSFRYAVVPRHRRLRGHPMAMSAALAAAILEDKAAHDLSDAVRRNARLVGYLDVSDPGVVRNVNRRGD